MKLIQQSKLFFKEGNSDKVYEIDLCALSPHEYLVNFRYGKRGSALKEGTKTPAAVSKENAEALFAGLELEKRKKGYQTETELFIELPLLDTGAPKSEKGAILQRLQDAVAGTNSFKTEWKTSRVIWKAGVLQMEEAIPFIIKLTGKGDELQVYSALWAFIQLRATQAVPVLNTFAFNVRQKPYIRNLAREGLLTLAGAEEMQRLGIQLMEQLPPEVRYAIEVKDGAALTSCLSKQTQEGQVNHFSDLYLLGKIQGWILPVLQEQLQKWAFRPPYFQQIRAIYKLAQIRADAATIAALSYRFEKEPAMFNRTASLDTTRKQYLTVIDQSVRVGAELKSADSKLAFSQFTKAYFQKNAAAFLKQAGKDADPKVYIRLATATLLQYTEADHSPAGERPLNDYGQYDYQTRRYSFTLVNYPECSNSLLLSTILFSNDATRKLQPNLTFITGKRIVTSKQYYYSPDEVEAAPPASMRNDPPSPATGSSVINAAVSAFKNIFGKKPHDTPPAPEQPVIAAAVTPPVTSSRLELFPEHWDAVPEAYVQLLIQAQMDIIHRFAYNNLKAHARYEEIGNRFDGKTLLQLLNSRFEQPKQLGFDVLQRRTAAFQSDPEFIGQVLNSNSAQARNWAQALVTNEPDTYLSDLGFILLLLFNTQHENNSWISDLLRKPAFSEERLQAVVGKTITELLHLAPGHGNNELAKNAIDRLTMMAPTQLERISWGIVEQLISSPLAANKILAGNILIRKAEYASPADIPLSLTDLFLNNELPEVRGNGIELWNRYQDNFLSENIRFVLAQADSLYREVVVATLARINQLITGDSQLGNITVQHLVYSLIRKEKFEGAHNLIREFIVSELRPYWNSGLKPQDITRLVHAHYRTSQLTGYDVLKAYDKTADFSLGQIISFGNHEILAIRQWCCHYFKQNPDRIRYERDKALTLLDAKWDDTRAYAFHYFQTEFTEADWDADTLISITDSIRPDVERFGKEMITRYFKPEDAMEYLTKLSEHPSVQVQAFVTSYLSLYAADKPALLQSLDYYFRSVLTRVNKGRVAKDRIFSFLEQEALKSEEAAAHVVPLLDEMSAQAGIADKATCIHILTNLKARFPHLEMHLMIKS